MKKHIIFIATLLAMTLSSCSDWLDVRGENIEKEENQFSSYKGFVSALTGLYMTMGNNSIYGEPLLKGKHGEWQLATSGMTLISQRQTQNICSLTTIMKAIVQRV